MNYLKIIGIIALVLGSLVVMVASYISFSSEHLAIEPFALGAAALLAGFLCLKRSRETY